MINRVRALWRVLGISIYNDSQRRNQNLKTISCIALVMEIPSMFGAIFYFGTPMHGFALGCLVYAILHVLIFYLAAVKKNRELAATIGTILALIASTNIALFARNGFAEIGRAHV